MCDGVCVNGMPYLGMNGMPTGRATRRVPLATVVIRARSRHNDSWHVVLWMQAWGVRLIAFTATWTVRAYLALSIRGNLGPFMISRRVQKWRENIFPFFTKSILKPFSLTLAFYRMSCRWLQWLDLQREAHGWPSMAWTLVWPSQTWLKTWRWQGSGVPL